MFRHITQIFLTGLILLSYSAFAQSSIYITDRGLIELKNISNDLLEEIAKENDYTLDRSYTSLDVPTSNIIASDAVKFMATAGTAGGAGVGAAGGLTVGAMAATGTATATGGPFFGFVVFVTNTLIGTVIGAEIGAGVSLLVAVPGEALKVARYNYLASRPEYEDNFEVLVNDPQLNPNPNRIEVHYKVESDDIPGYTIESSCLAFLARENDNVPGELDECVWESIFPQDVPGYVRIGDRLDKAAGQDKVVARFSIHDPINL